MDDNLMWDLAIDPNTGDLKIAPTNDFDVCTGSKVVEQEVRVRLRMQAGQWHLDPTKGSLGSHLRELSRVPSFIAVTDAERMVREALAPMSQISIHRVDCQVDPKDQRRLVIKVIYSIVEPGDEAQGDELTLTTSIRITG